MLAILRAIYRPSTKILHVNVCVCICDCLSSLPSCQLVQLTHLADCTAPRQQQNLRVQGGSQTLTLICFLQYRHLTMCLIIGSDDNH